MIINNDYFLKYAHWLSHQAQDHFESSKGSYSRISINDVVGA